MLLTDLGEPEMVMRWMLLLGILSLLGCSNEAERGKNAKDAPDRPRLTDTRPKPAEKPKPKDANPGKDTVKPKAADSTKIEPKDKDTGPVKEK